jgi:hypothetical protein
MKTTTMTTLVLLVVCLVGSGAATEPMTVTQRDALARAVQSAWLSLENGMTLGASVGTPVSAKYEIDDGAFQLSVYTLKADPSAGDTFWEVIVDHDAGQIARAEIITDGGDLAAARDQRAAMARAARTLTAATMDAVHANPGYRAVSAYPALHGDRPVAEVTLLGDAGWKVVSERLD